MTRPKQDLAARAAQLPDRAPKKAPTLADVPVPTPKGGAARQPIPRAKPVRLTIDVEPQAYQALRLLVIELGAELGAARITHSDVVRALLDSANDDPAVRAALTAKLRDER
ncbi:hypothetical protein [Cellulosimicrobium sp. NPDC057862]|uniref:hypothetical protein n=1 Tax=Actinomycetes TaxID=1760 RepID=UPI003670D868